MKPRNRAELVRYLTKNPYLKHVYPPGVSPLCKDGKTEGRKFLRMQGNEFVFEDQRGRECVLKAKAKDMQFHDDHFSVSLAVIGCSDKIMDYYYLDSPYTSGTK